MADEVARIRGEYERRRREIPVDFYARWRPENLFARHSQERALLTGLRRERVLPLGDQRILEVGCGDGDWLGIFAEFGAAPENLAGIDLDEARISVARARYPRSDLRTGEASHLPWADESFDLVAQSTVFSSILSDQMKRDVASEMLRVLRPGGVIVWYDFFVNNPANPHVRGVRRSEVEGLFGGCRGRLVRTTLAPPLARWLVPRSWAAATLLASLRVLDTHFLGVLRKEIR
ncbi:MAG: class I SAM-dependent methyltransferase [Holophagales bacterium]|jgi:SAM-dependent methyltransferase|nr:MAG: class I SAM-dependent methyltransferase [Holophagales bacterium]